MEDDRLVIGEKVRDLESIMISTWNNKKFERSWFRVGRDLEKNTSSIERLEGTPNTNLNGVSTLWVNNYLFVSGGRDLNNINSNQIILYDSHDCSWSKLQHVLDQPRSDHVSLSLVTSKTSSFVFGGNNAKFGSHFYPTKDGGIQDESEIINPNDFKGSEKIMSYILHEDKRRKKNNSAIFWVIKGSNYEVLQYTFETDTWRRRLSSDSTHASKRPLNMQLPQVENYYLAVMEEHIWGLDKREERTKWKPLCKLNVNLEAEGQIHLLHLGKDKDEHRIALLLMDMNYQLITLYFRFDKAQSLMKPDGGAIYNLEEGSQLATANFMSQVDYGSKKRKVQSIWRLNVKVKRQETPNQFLMDVEDNRMWGCSSHVSVIQMNNPSHKAFHIQNHTNILKHSLYIEKSGICVHDEWGFTLEDIVTRDGGRKIFWRKLEWLDTQYVEMSFTFRRIVKGILEGFLSSRKQKICIERLTMKDIVFRKDDDEYTTPMLIPCDTVGVRAVSQDIKVLSSLIRCIATKHKLMDDLGPVTSSFVETLKQTRLHDVLPEEEALSHPMFLNFGAKVDYLMRMREKLHAPNFNLNIDMVDLYISGKSLRPKKGWRQFFDDGNKHFNSQLNHDNIPDVDFNSPHRFIRFLRDCFVHGNDRRKEDSSLPYISRDAFGQLMEKTCPSLLPVFFAKHGILLVKETKATENSLTSTP